MGFFWKTYDEWQAEGRQVKRGEKAQKYEDGQALFKKEQTYDVEAYYEKRGYMRDD